MTDEEVIWTLKKIIDQTEWEGFIIQTKQIEMDKKKLLQAKIESKEDKDFSETFYIFQSEDKHIIIKSHNFKREFLLSVNTRTFL